MPYTTSQHATSWPLNLWCHTLLASQQIYSTTWYYLYSGCTVDNAFNLMFFLVSFPGGLGMRLRLYSQTHTIQYALPLLRDQWHYFSTRRIFHELYVFISLSAQRCSWLPLRKDQLWVDGGPLYHSQWNNVSSDYTFSPRVNFPLLVNALMQVLWANNESGDTPCNDVMKGYRFEYKFFFVIFKIFVWLTVEKAMHLHVALSQACVISIPRKARSWRV